MLVLIEQVLYIDRQQEAPGDFCRRCGGARYLPGLRCIRCEGRGL